MDEEYSHLYGIAGRATSLQPVNPDNLPNAWEKTTLLQIEKGVKENRIRDLTPLIYN